MRTEIISLERVARSRSTMPFHSRRLEPSERGELVTSMGLGIVYCLVLLWQERKVEGPATCLIRSFTHVETITTRRKVLSCVSEATLLGTFSPVVGQEGASIDIVASYASTARADGSIVLAGVTTGDWFGDVAGSADFAAVALDEDGQELWRWQVNVGGRPDLLQRFPP